MSKQTYHTTVQSPLGEILLTSDGKALTGLYTGKMAVRIKEKGERKPEYFKEAIRQLTEYFSGKRSEFDLPLSAEGTEFQKRVWQGLQGIGYGRTASYADLAKSLKAPKSFRAVGNANGKNPISIIIPCHRVIAADGGLGGYSGGLEMKKWLLRHEQGHQRVA